ncbi:gamma-glutamylcyclotransferase family protein [Paenalkalicoccus suaedae]|uniref:gamma-glutamylcyclotransferase family protein n=1 Tax=Paenalkalicoccus suaedae TaxID=2592382 RepID=UPI00158CFA8F|nr:gamma-glutamylcyclotransferase family protein [Paenalkalicoccus suaedae]
MGISYDILVGGYDKVGISYDILVGGYDKVSIGYDSLEGGYDKMGKSNDKLNKSFDKVFEQDGGGQLLFSYGTLRDEDVQRVLFGRVVEVREAVLDGHAAYVGEDGYYFLKKGIGVIEGAVLRLTGAELAVADRWEEVPVYARVAVDVRVAGEVVRAWVYVRPDAVGESVDLAHAQGSFSAGEKEAYVREAREMMARIRGGDGN